MAKDNFTVIDLLSRLRSLGVELHAENGRLLINAPKGALNSSLREELSHRKAEIVRFLADSRSFTISDSTPIPVVPRDRALSVSFSQERLWFLNQLEPESVAYNSYGVHRLEGHLRVDILSQSLSEIIRRHEALRTAFSEIDGKPVQVVSPPSPFNLQIVDLQGLSEAEREERALGIAIEEAQKPFDLSKGPLFRAILVQLWAEEYLLAVIMHHIITDGWSLGIFTRELEALYKAFSDGRPSPLPELSIQYADFAHWQREWLKGKVLEDQLSYWKQKLSGDLPVLQLPTDRPRPAVQGYRGAKKWFVLSKQLTEALARLSQSRGITLFMTLLAAFEALLYRYTGQTDFAVGTPIANRTRAELEGLIGCFVNTLVLRTDLSGDPQFVGLLRKVRETALGAFAHQHMPFEKLVEVLKPVRDMSYAPLFQVMFALQNFPWVPADLQGLTLTPELTEASTSMFDLTLYMWEEEKGLSGTIEYSTDLFDDSTIERMVDHFEVLLESVTTDPDRRLSELTLLRESERHQVLVEWNDTAAEYPKDECFNQLFEEQVGRTPEATAVICADVSLTYKELNCRANQVANYLRRLGAQPGSIAGICTDRSIDMVVSLLGILKAGCAYMPLDPHFPADRIEFMLKDSNSGILMTQSHLQENIQGFSGEVICIDSDWDRISKEKDTNLTELPGPNDLAYVIYTSGSTGKPKGVQIPHRALVNFLYSMQKEPGLTAADTLLSVTTMSFDIFGLELYLPLLSGGRVVIAEREDTLDGSRLANLIKKHNVSVMQATPSTWRLFIESGWSGYDALKVLCGGEALPSDLVEPLLKRCKELWNLYGPTETTIWSTAYRIKSVEDPILIGSPIANTQTYILDGWLQSVPVGVVGELYIGGDGLAQGYLNRPELTEEKFIPNPFSGGAGGRIYKTGDLARYRPDGNIEYLGRVDHQVKLRGFRIELGEIESRLKEVEGVHDCVVVLREDRVGDQRLVAYYVVREGQTISVSDVRRYLQAKLPNYMVPQHFVELKSIPLTPNGKVDRDGIRLLPLETPQTDHIHVSDEPLTKMEQTLTDIWKEVLGLDHISVHDNFFELGGYSLLSIQVVTKLERKIGFRINPGELVYQTLGQLAASLEQRTDSLTPSAGRSNKGWLFQAIKSRIPVLNRQR